MFRNTKFNHIALLLGFSLFLGTLASCVDKEIDLDSGNQSDGIIDLNYEGFSLGFSVALDAAPGSRGSGDFDSYIDTKDKFRVLFFDEYGSFLFEAIDRTVSHQGEDTNGQQKYFIRIPLNYIIDRKGNRFDVEAIRNQLRDYPFKIAILANWPNDAVIEGSDTDPDEDSNDTFIGTTVIKGEPNWGWENSLLNPDNATGWSGTSENFNLKNINDLHHLVADGTYNDDTRKDRPTNLDVYDMILENGNMGVKKSWVKNTMGFTKSPQADAWIRKNWDPSKPMEIQLTDKMNDPRDTRYINLRYLWNFTAAANFNPNETAPKKYEDCEVYFDINGSETFYKEWLDRNGTKLHNWLDVTDGTALPSRMRGNEYGDEIDDLEFFQFSDPDSEATGESVKATRYSNGKKVGIHLPVGSVDYNQTKGDKLEGVLKIPVEASGTLRIRAYNPHATQEARLHVDFKKVNTNDVHASKNFDIKAGEETTVEYELTVETDGGDFFIYTVNRDSKPNPVVIYQIEYIKAKYLYDTDREAIIPSETNPIPMYGVQNFEALGEDWISGTTFDLSNSSTGLTTTVDYDFKNIYLVRSVAKVELYLKQKAAYVFMRSMNRSGRCETVDVETPTDELWKETHQISADYKDVCDWFRVKAKGPLYYHNWTSSKDNNGNTKYTDTEPKDKTQLKEYSNWLAWFYGSWAETSWYPTYLKDAEGKRVVTTEAWDFEKNDNQKEGINPSDDNNPYYPRIYYPDINRSDFCEFYYEGMENGLHKYVIYVPDKNIDDPNYPGIISSTPKIPRIEYRMNYDHNSNLDDNWCYRIYFCDQQPSTGFAKDEYETKFDKELRDHNVISGSPGTVGLNKTYGMWPIMRNHIYRFYVEESLPTQLVVRAAVSDWGYNKIQNDW